MTKRRQEQFQKVVLAWYAANARAFMWRQNGDTPPDAYMVLVSEVMLQQTQTSRVQEKLPLFLQQFPTVHELARADNATIIKAWQGMGYNSRALRLRDCARAVVERYNGVIPASAEELLVLPGIGAYTASAVSAFAYHCDVPVVDVNIRRVYSRVIEAMLTTASMLPEKVVTEFAASVFPHGSSSEWHQAIMDLGAMLCTARSPKCDDCPVKVLCASAGKMQEKMPQKRAEPSFRGVPNRIWRGKIVQMLRELPENTTLPAEIILDRLFSAALFEDTHQTEAWLRGLLEKLEQDAIVRIISECKQQNGIERMMLSLATGESE